MKQKKWQCLYHSIDGDCQGGSYCFKTLRGSELGAGVMSVSGLLGCFVLRFEEKVISI